MAEVRDDWVNSHLLFQLMCPLHLILEMAAIFLSKIHAHLKWQLYFSAKSVHINNHFFLEDVGTMQKIVGVVTGRWLGGGQRSQDFPLAL